MPDQNWVVHLGAVFGFAALAWWMLRAQRDLELLRRLLLSGFSQSPVYVEKPSVFLARLASALGVEYGGDLDGDKDRFQRVSLDQWLRLHLKNRIKSIKCEKMQIIVTVEETDKYDQTNLDTPVVHDVLVRIVKSEAK